MTGSEILLLVLGAIAGAVVAPIYNKRIAAITDARLRSASAKRGRDSQASLLAKKIVKYYAEHGISSSLYVPNTIGAGRPIALLHDASVTIPTVVNRDSDPLFSCDHELTRLPYSRAVLRRYRRRGVRLFDGEFMWVKSAVLDGDDLTELNVGRVNFYSYATLLYKMQREIVSRWRRPVLHDRHLQNFRAALGGGGLKPQAIGCITALLVERSDGTYVAVARRSAKVVNGPGTRSLVPVYGMECNAIAGRTSQYGLTFYNFVREFSEEFFDLEEPVHMMLNRKVAPDWIFNLPPAADVLTESIAGRLIIKRTGVCINPNDAILNFSYVAHFTDPAFFERLEVAMEPNWENSANRDLTIGAIQFMKLNDPTLDQLATDQLIDPSSIFALDLARQYLADLAAEAATTGAS